MDFEQIATVVEIITPPALSVEYFIARTHRLYAYYYIHTLHAIYYCVIKYNIYAQKTIRFVCVKFVIILIDNIEYTTTKYLLPWCIFTTRMVYDIRIVYYMYHIIGKYIVRKLNYYYYDACSAARELCALRNIIIQ